MAYRRAAVALIVFVLVTGVSCTSASKTTSNTLRRGTLVVADAGYLFSGPVLLGADSGSKPLDPQSYDTETFEIARCCLSRTLVANPGLPTDRGGSELRPDLATRLPDVSDDGLTWTFHLKHGIHYGPPLQRVEVTAGDFIRALKREGSTDNSQNYGSLYYSIIEGYTEYLQGKSDSISGLEAPDRYTFVVRLTQPAGDLPNRFGLPATAPLPPDPFHPAAKFGVATGHGDYGRFLVSTGPYMIEGMNAVDFSIPSESQRPAEGFIPDRRLTLVRNPSWKRATDELRPANVDKIVIVSERDHASTLRDVAAGKADVSMPVYNSDTTAELLKIQAEPMRAAIHLAGSDTARPILMNTAQRPFDDVWVRRAANYSANRAAMLTLRGGSLAGRVSGHIGIDSLEDDVLLNYDPYQTPGGMGSLEMARAAMRHSRYDRNHDGICDTGAACRGSLYVSTTPWDPARGTANLAAAKILKDNLAGIGIHLNLQLVDAVPQVIHDPATHWSVALGTAWQKDYLNAANYFVPIFSSSGLPNAEAGTSFNWTLVGASRDQLRGWGYTTTVPNVDDRLNQCQSLTGGAGVQCWATFDQYMMKEVVPWIPVYSESAAIVTSPRVVAYSYDQFAAMPALDQIAVRPGTQAPKLESLAPTSPIEGIWQTAHLTQDVIVKGFESGGGSEKDAGAFFTQLGGGAKQYAIITLVLQRGALTEFEGGDGKPPIQGSNADYKLSGNDTIVVTSGPCVASYRWEIRGSVLQLSPHKLVGCEGDQPPSVALFTSAPFTRVP